MNAVLAFRAHSCDFDGKCNFECTFSAWSLRRAEPFAKATRPGKNLDDGNHKSRIVTSKAVIKTAVAHILTTPHPVAVDRDQDPLQRFANLTLGTPLNIPTLTTGA